MGLTLPRRTPPPAYPDHGPFPNGAWKNGEGTRTLPVDSGPEMMNLMGELPAVMGAPILLPIACRPTCGILGSLLLVSPA